MEAATLDQSLADLLSADIFIIEIGRCKCYVACWFAVV